MDILFDLAQDLTNGLRFYAEDNNVRSGNRFAVIRHHGNAPFLRDVA